MKSISVARDIDVEVLLEIIKHYDDYKENSKNGLVILLNGAWGSGKSTFLSQLEDKINEDEEVDLFLNYNAYEYDFYDTECLKLTELSFVTLFTYNELNMFYMNLRTSYNL